MKSPYATYRCGQCMAAHQRIEDKGPSRKLWCGRCGCNRWFMRSEEPESPHLATSGKGRAWLKHSARRCFANRWWSAGH